MNWKKIETKLLELEYMDERRLVCKAAANYVDSTNFVLFTHTTYVTQNNLPSSMLISVCGKKLHISEIKLFGGFKRHFCCYELKYLEYINSHSKDFRTTYDFIYVAGGNNTPFRINTYSDCKRVKKVVESIKEFQILSRQ